MSDKHITTNRNRDTKPGKHGAFKHVAKPATFAEVLRENSCRKSEPAESDKHICEHAKNILTIKDHLEKLDYSQPTFFEMEVKNVGEVVARGIKLDATNIMLLDSESFKGKSLGLKLDSTRDFYQIPDLNPNEGVKLDIWTKGGGLGYSYDGLFSPEDTVPEITYASGMVSPQMYYHAPSTYYSMWDFLKTFPALVSVVFVIIFCFLVTGGIILVLSVAIGLLQGKPLSEIFATSPPVGSATLASETAE